MWTITLSLPRTTNSLGKYGSDRLLGRTSLGSFAYDADHDGHDVDVHYPLASLIFYFWDSRITIDIDRDIE